MTTVTMPESIQIEIVQSALRAADGYGMTEHKLSEMKKYAVAMAEAGVAAYGVIISKDAESDKRPSEESRIIEIDAINARLERLCARVDQLHECSQGISAETIDLMEKIMCPKRSEKKSD